MFSQSNRIMLISTALLAIATSPAIAGKVVVKKSGANPTIQDGVNAASAGDKIEIRSGTYQETVFINNTKDGLTLYAKGTVILDALPSGGVGDGPGIIVGADNVTLEGFTIRNARPYGESLPHLPGSTLNGYGVSMEADGLTLKKMRLDGNEDAGVFMESHRSDLTVNQCTINKPFFGIGIDSSGPNLVVKKSIFRGAGYPAVMTSGSDAVIKDCKFWNMGWAVEALGANVRIEGNDLRSCAGVNVDDIPAGSGFTINDNSFRGCEYNIIAYDADGTVQSQITGNTIIGNGVEGGISTISSNVRIHNNVIEGVSDVPLWASGSDNVISKNKIVNCYEGIESDGDNPTIVDNVVDGIISGNPGIDVNNVITGGVVSGNTVKRVADPGIELGSSTTGVLVDGNSVRWSMTGIEVSGSNHTVSSNVVRDCYEDGFYFYSSSTGITAYDNTARGNMIDGFDVDGSNCVLSDNVSEDNGAEGIEVNGDNNTIINNRSKRNRIDMANDGTGNSFSGNNYDTGGDATPPEID